MLRILVVCDVCGVNERFVVLTPDGWLLDTGTPREGIHACSEECARNYTRMIDAGWEKTTTCA